ncbi:MAG TPA: dihydrolipoyl dehydrogenase [Methylomirabilota bacterium]|nr:dihydrolipoyl dehydrogenase [Methylomirabilota bacterium]
MVVGSVSRGCQVVVIGAGPGGYVAALRLAQLGKDVILVDKGPRLGGVCLNVGCIPSKALIHAADLVWEARHAKTMGITVDGLSVDMPKLVAWKDGIVDRLTGGVDFLCSKNGVEVVYGTARFVSDRSLQVTTEDGQGEIEFQQAVIATGSDAMELPGLKFDGHKVIGSTEALSLQEVPERLAVVGAGYIGLELGTVYAKLGAQVTVVEFLPEVLPGLDRDVAKALQRQLKKLGVKLLMEHRAESFDDGDEPALVTTGPDGSEVRVPANLVMMSVGRVPRSRDLGLEAIGVATDERGFIRVDDRQRTNVAGIYAIGDVVGGALLAHKAYQEAKVAAEVIAGEPAAFDNVAIPAVIYTDPEVAWTGLTEQEARDAGHTVSTGTFSFKASGRAMTLDATDGFIKVVADADSRQLLGVTAVGRGVSELMGEATLALEMGAFLEDVGLTIHPHPTMSEALQEAVEAALGKAVHQVNT